MTADLAPARPQPLSAATPLRPADAAPALQPVRQLPQPAAVMSAGRSAEYLDLMGAVLAEEPLPPLRGGRAVGDGDALRICYLVPITGPGGGARVLFEHANHLAHLGDDVTVLSHFGRPDWIELRARFVEVPFGQRLAEGIPPDVDVVVAGFWDQVLLARRAAVAPVVHFEQGPHHLFEEVDVATLVLVAESVSAADATMAVGVGGTRALADRYGVAARLVPNAVDCDRFHPGDDASTRRSVLFVGPDGSPFKGIDLARTIAAGLAESHPAVEVVWVTPRPPVEGDFGRVVVQPAQEELARLYREALVYVCTSRFETWGLPALEAMASGTPVVSGAHAGIVTFARDGENALLGPVGDADALLELTRRVLDEPELAERLRAGGLATAKGTTWPEVLRDIRSFFLETLQEVERRGCLAPGAGNGDGDQGGRAGGGGRERDGRRAGAQEDAEPVLELEGIELVGPDDHERLLARVRTLATSELAVPVSRPVRGAFRRVTWEVVARRTGAHEGLTRLYLPVRSEEPPELSLLPESLAGLEALACGDHQAALAALLPFLQQAGADSQPTLLRWVVVALIGLGRHAEALELAATGCEAYPTHPDPFALAFLAATAGGLAADLDAAMRAVRLLGTGARFAEWFDDPLAVMRAHLAGKLGL